MVHWALLSGRDADGRRHTARRPGDVVVPPTPQRASQAHQFDSEQLRDASIRPSGVAVPRSHQGFSREKSPKTQDAGPVSTPTYLPSYFWPSTRKRLAYRIRRAFAPQASCDALVRYPANAAAMPVTRKASSVVGTRPSRTCRP